MNATAPDATLPELRGRLAHPPVAGWFDEGELEGLPDPVCRYLRTSIAAGTPLAQSARLGMRGAVKLGRWWIPFRARQVSAPITGWCGPPEPVTSSRASTVTPTGRGMQWKLLGLLRLLHAQGPDLVPQRGRPGRRRGRVSAHGAAPAVRRDLGGGRRPPPHRQLPPGRLRARGPPHPGRRWPGALGCPGPVGRSGSQQADACRSTRQPGSRRGLGTCVEPGDARLHKPISRLPQPPTQRSVWVGCPVPLPAATATTARRPGRSGHRGP
jgi:hypothetical protein